MAPVALPMHVSAMPLRPWAAVPPRQPRQVAKRSWGAECRRPRLVLAAGAAASEAPRQAARPPQQAGGAAPGLLLEGVRIVLVSPKTPPNIGAVLRCAENFEAHDVVIVDPRCDPWCEEVRVVSCGSAVYEAMQVVPSLKEALADVTGSVGFTRRAGAGRVTHPSLSSLLAQFPAVLPAPVAAEGRPAQEGDIHPLEAGSSSSSGSSSPGQGRDTSSTTSAETCVGAGSSQQQDMQRQGGGVRLALVFGREESGLLEAELLLCSHACAIPTGRSQPSLNLSHAVAVVLAQLFEARAQQLGGPDLFEPERARHVRQQALAPVEQGELEALLARWAGMLEGAGISAAESTGGGDKGNHGRRRRAMGHLRALLLRGQANTAEVRALHGMVKELEERLHKPR